MTAQRKQSSRVILSLSTKISRVYAISEIIVSLLTVACCWFCAPSPFLPSLFKKWLVYCLSTGVPLQRNTDEVAQVFVECLSQKEGGSSSILPSEPCVVSFRRGREINTQPNNKHTIRFRWFIKLRFGLFQTQV